MNRGKSEVTFEAVGEDPPADRYRACRATLIGPDHNQPEHYEGYHGFVGWPGVTRLRSGRWIVTFTSGLWHATFPWTEEVRRDPACRQQFERMAKIGLPDMPAPRGGRAHIMHSDDQGASWSKPRTLVDTDGDDRHPTILELDDGVLLCTWRSSRYPKISHSHYMRSLDGGRTWGDPLDPGGKPLRGSFSNGSAIQCSDGSVIWAISGTFAGSAEPRGIGIFRSADSARTFELASMVKADHVLAEPTAAQLPGGGLVMACRREGDMCWSDDGGRTWTQSNATGWGLYDPHLLQLPNGVLALFAGSYHGGAIRVLLSPDGGHTWRGPDDDSEKPYGYSVDPSVYGYGHPMLLPDGTVYLVYLHTGGHRPEDARTESLFGLRVRVRDSADGIDILPAPGSPADGDTRTVPR